MKSFRINSPTDLFVPVSGNFLDGPKAATNKTNIALKKNPVPNNSSKSSK